MMAKAKSFNAQAIELKGKNLIEASAGTGKTFSIAVLALRLVLERKASIKEILMVTFTKAAVAELEERIRYFFKEAHRCSVGLDCDIEIINTLVKQQIEKIGIEAVQLILKESVLLLDETSVLTIHGFCQQTLNQYPFKTQQLSNVELMGDEKTIIAKQVDLFWRTYITSIPEDILIQLTDKGLSRSKIGSIISKHLGGKGYLGYVKQSNYKNAIEDESFVTFREKISNAKKEEEEYLEGILQHIVANEREYKEKSASNTYAKKANLHLVEYPKQFYDIIYDKFHKNKLSNFHYTLYEEIINGITSLMDLMLKTESIILDFNSQIYCFAIQEISKKVTQDKLNKNQLSYNDLIYNLHEAVLGKNQSYLQKTLNQQYKAIFIDEFQDTDKLQFEIFDTLFSNQDAIVFYIGDPKQSIYAWRKADIATYFKAKKSVSENIFEMNENFRSSVDYIHAMNDFFAPIPDFDAFHYKNKADKIDYIKVYPPQQQNVGYISYQDRQEPALKIISCKNKDQIAVGLAYQIHQLLTNPTYQLLDKKGEMRKIKPSDIGILIRNNYEKISIKKELAKYQIPSVTINDEKVLKSEEAKYILYILSAIHNYTLGNINRALLSSLTGFKVDDILKMSSHERLEIFKELNAIWEKEGVFMVLNKFFTLFNVIQNLIHQTENGERIITNIYQIVELLHKAQSTKDLSILDLLAWLKRNIDGEENDGDEYKQRIESDDEAVKIVTIHASKGLQYNIVFAPFLDMKLYDGDEFEFRDENEEDSIYYLIEKYRISPEQNEWYQNQTKQENSRLIYVALTRAVYGAYVYHNQSSKNSALDYFIDAKQASEYIHLAGVNLDEITKTAKVNSKKIIIPPYFVPNIHFKLKEENWRKISYSALRLGYENKFRLRGEVSENEYDKFIFDDLARGIKAGNMLHEIFENIHFAKPESWNFIIAKSVNNYFPKTEHSTYEFYEKMLHEVLETNIQIGDSSFSLSEIQQNKCIHELEFDFKISNFHTNQLSQLSSSEMEISIANFPQLEGLMNGKIDLFFEHDNKYYVLDWKSNFLGNTVEDYHPDLLVKAMNESNYHLQYLIYCVALKKFLHSRKGNFNYEKQFGGVLYLFIRGMRKGSKNGIFARKPTLNLINKVENLLS